MKNDFYETELKKVQKCCNKYGYHAFLRFDELHIRSKFESWYFMRFMLGHNIIAAS